MSYSEEFENNGQDNQIKINMRIGNANLLPSGMTRIKLWT